LQIKTKIVSSHTADYVPVKQEVNGTVILPPLVFPALSFDSVCAANGVNYAEKGFMTLWACNHKAFLNMFLQKSLKL
jgi:hypothetical protein